jgi:hypothetical protein
LFTNEMQTDASSGNKPASHVLRIQTSFVKELLKNSRFQT